MIARIMFQGDDGEDGDDGDDGEDGDELTRKKSVRGRHWHGVPGHPC